MAPRLSVGGGGDSMLERGFYLGEEGKCGVSIVFFLLLRLSVGRVGGESMLGKGFYLGEEGKCCVLKLLGNKKTVRAHYCLTHIALGICFCVCASVYRLLCICFCV